MKPERVVFPSLTCFNLLLYKYIYDAKCSFKKLKVKYSGNAFLGKTKTFWLKYFQNKMWEWLSSRNYILLLLENKKQLILRSKWCNYIKWFFKIFLFWLSSAFHTEKPNVVFYLGPTYSGMIHFLLSPLWWHKRSLDQMGWCFDKLIATFHLLKKKKNHSLPLYKTWREFHSWKKALEMLSPNSSQCDN